MKTLKNPLVSIIVTTRNEERNIGKCLESIKEQTYPKLQIIVVDNNSTDKTKEIAKEYTKYIYNKGPERSAQRNYGAKKANGEYVLFIDADMELSSKVIEECVKKLSVLSDQLSEKEVGGVIIPEESFGVGFWAKAKALERSFYLGNNEIEAARFFPKKVFSASGGFDEALTGPEDWDFSQRVRLKYKIERIAAFIRHNEGELSLKRTLQKKYYYAKKFGPYMKKKDNKDSTEKQFSILGRYAIFFKQPKKLLKDPILSCGMLFMKTSEFFFGGLGYIIGLMKYSKQQ